MAHLVYGPMVILDLITQIQQERPGTTKQGVYAVLRDLKQQDVVILTTGTASLNMAWVDRVAEYVTQTQQRVEALPGHFLNLQDGEKVQYTFRNPATTDVFWNHVLQSLNRSIPPEQPFFSYCPHMWFFMAHTQRERALRDQLNRVGRQYLVLGGANTKHDRAVRAECDGEMSQYHAVQEPPFERRTVYINAIGHFLIQVRFSSEFAQRLDDIYAHSSATVVTEQLATLIRARSTVRFTIFHNTKKAEQFRKTVQRYFFILRSE